MRAKDYVANAYTLIMSLYIKQDAYDTHKWDEDILWANDMLQNKIFPKMIEEGGKETEHGIIYHGFEYRLIGGGDCDEKYYEDVLKATNLSETTIMEQNLPFSTIKTAFLMLQDYGLYGYEPSLNYARADKASQKDLLHTLELRANKNLAKEEMQNNPDKYLIELIKKSPSIIELLTPCLLEQLSGYLYAESIPFLKVGELSTYIKEDVISYIEDICPDIAEDYNTSDISVSFDSGYASFENDFENARQIYFMVDKTRYYLPVVRIDTENITTSNLEKKLGKIKASITYPTMYDMDKELIPYGDRDVLREDQEICTTTIHIPISAIDIDLSGTMPYYGQRTDNYPLELVASMDEPYEYE